MGQKTTMSPSSSSKKRKADHHHAKNKFSSGGPGSKSRGSSAEPPSAKSQKRALKQERQSQRKHADCVMEAKKIWNKLRLKTNSKEEIRSMTEELMTLMKGKVNEIALQHDASRVVQAALQFGTVEERRQVMKELTQASLLELAKNQYAHYVVLKSIKYCYNDKDCVKMIVKSFKGHIPKLAVHATGSKIVEALFQTFPNKSTAVLQQEFYGPHFALFASDVLAANNSNNQVPMNLSSHLEKSPDKKEVSLTFIKNILEKGIEKSLVGYHYYQELFAEYVANCSPNDVRQIAPSIVDHSIHLLSSKAGTRVVVACASYGTAKDRKRIQRNLKGYTKSALLHKDGYLALLRLVQVTDDTVSTQRNILNELLVSEAKKEGDDNNDETSQQLPPLLEIALNDQGCKLFLMLLANAEEDGYEVSWKKIFDPYELDLMDPNPTIIESGSETPTRKKDPERHRQELLQYVQKPLLELCQNHPRELMFSLSGSALIREVYNTWHSKDLVDAVVEVCVSELDNKKAEGDEEEEDGDHSLFENRVGHLAIKNLILCDVEENNNSSNNEGKKLLLAQAFWDQLKDRLMDVAKSNRGAFVVAALCKVPSVREEVLKKLKKKTAKLKELADDQEGKGTAIAGYQALLKEIEGN